MDTTPVYVSCGGSCTVTHVVSVSFPPFQLTLEEGGAIAGAILAVWVTGWAFRVLIRHIRHTDGINQPESE